MKGGFSKIPPPEQRQLMRRPVMAVRKRPQQGFAEGIKSLLKAIARML
ncbi:MAG: hypothetical protein ACI4IW_02465 [Oscillospiraceae bacterium]